MSYYIQRAGKHISGALYSQADGNGERWLGFVVERDSKYHQEKVSLCLSKVHEKCFDSKLKK